ncbi:MAG: M23 family metallopeptidase, partial [Sandaracinaceae bacterium]|nr:M23 family metallopeptidase [Sandaracinaceae bacterium]
KRRHRGIDFDSTRGEPVLAIASGVVTFSGVDLPGRGTARPMRSRAANRFSPRRMGKGGRYVCIEHDTARDPENSADPPDRLVSCSMHLDEINVENGERVERGQRIGTVGRTGIKYSAPHLHFEVIRNGRRIDPSKLLEEFVIRNPPPKPKRIRRGSR